MENIQENERIERRWKEFVAYIVVGYGEEDTISSARIR
jgi:hypothetical protein